jgi:hypothetical protein
MFKGFRLGECNQFATHFNTVHLDFRRSMYKCYPNLTLIRLPAHEFMQ